jgi:hypothetical protein
MTRVKKMILVLLAAGLSAAVIGFQADSIPCSEKLIRLQSAQQFSALDRVTL